ncbi:MULTISPECIES: hypothetical protein [Priestia]|jgi:hypothetical protein|uniref:Uncharacterized protein n=4 Tax=Priestia megaterium TaxID=1404 RepID=A0AAE5P5X7_PRIMG|nr:MULTISPECIES: hypothetical protein [Priestia]KQU15886.1 hypothetical protein ASG61_29455 [Bacillus sp. Leaf75]RFB18622.1 hypothetical protein DZB87_29685 [Bacillus sp. ALD]RFB31968.1 hypothetical protein DZB86_31295 [Bacillus sp. RC]MBD8114933.1 hypothetical protein [Priestia megaterium]MBM6602278.1 hypothetical protein [Priestia megaterium]
MPKDLVKELLDKGFKVVDLKCVGTINIISAKELYLEEISTDTIVDMLSLNEDSIKFSLDEKLPYFVASTKPLAGYINSESELPIIEDAIIDYKVYVKEAILQSK